MKRIIILLILLSSVAVTFICINVYGETKETELCITFLKSYGWDAEKEPCEKSEVTIPAEFDEVYKSYNIIQKDAGLDLEPYKGKSGMRYTFVINNYPIDVGECVYGDVICIDGKPTAGDIKTNSMSGFMHSLKKIN